MLVKDPPYMHYMKMFLPQLYRFIKEPVPQDSEEKEEFASKLFTFGVSLKQYEKAYAMPDVTM